VTQEFDTWRKIRDVDGEEGWVHQTLVYSTRHVIVEGKAPATLYRHPEEDSRALAQFEPGVVARLIGCQKDWCEIDQGDYDGWMPKTSLWGVYPGEESE